MSTILGKDIRLKIDGTIVAGAKSCEIEAECDLIEVSSPSSGSSKTFIPGRKSWSISKTFLVKSFAAPLLRAGEAVTVVVGTSSDTLTGSAIIQSCKITATKGNLSQGSFKLQGSGPLIQSS